MNAKISDFYLKDCRINKLVERHYSRIIEDNVDGDELRDMGRKSAEFTIEGKLTLEQFLDLEEELSKGQPIFQSPYGKYKVVARSLFYESNGNFKLVLLEDIR